MRAELRLSPTGSGASFAPKSFTFDSPATLELDGHVRGLDFLPAPASHNAVFPSYALVIDQAFICYDGSSFTMKSVIWHSDSVCVNGHLLGDRVHTLSDGDKLQFGEYRKRDHRFTVECAVKVRLSFHAPPALVPSRTNWGGVHKLVDDLRRDQARARHSPPSSSHDKPTAPPSAGQIPTSVPTSVLSSQTRLPAPKPVPTTSTPFPTSLSVPSPLPSSVPITDNFPGPSLTPPGTPTCMPYGTLVTILRSCESVPAADINLRPPTCPLAPSRPDTLNTVRSRPSGDSTETPARRSSTAHDVDIGLGTGALAHAHGAGRDGSIPRLSTSVASAELAISRAHSAWMAARLDLLPSSSPPAAEVSTAGTRMAAIDMALARLQSAWLFIEKHQSSCSSASVRSGPYAALSASPAPSAAHECRTQQHDQLPHHRTDLTPPDDRHRTPPRSTSPTAHFHGSSVPQSCLSPATSAPSSSPSPVPSSSLIDLSTGLLWQALLAQVTVIICIFALR